MNQCVVCGKRIYEEYEQICTECRKRYSSLAGISQKDQSIRMLTALLQIERRQHEETKRMLAKAEHDRDRYYRRLQVMMDGIQFIIKQAEVLRRPQCNSVRFENMT